MPVFKARARALDMLGRQQIAGIPTAISELFKNAHDAYADRVEVDLYRSTNLLILRDDGLGMTKDDFETRWLILGTESKLGQGIGVEPPPADTTKPERPILGEKGIGRLAIAALGPQLLVLTRAVRDGQLCDLVAAFIHWGLFEAPGIDLDQIELPVHQFPGGTLPEPNHIELMVRDLRQTTENLRKSLPKALYSRITNDLDAFGLNIPWLETRLEGPSLKGDGHGTQFYILPADESISANIDADQEDRASPLTKLLIGFTNTMTPDRAAPRISTAFRDHVTDSRSVDLIAEREFFTPSEFLNADHRVTGEFDAFGQFSGTVSVYGEETSGYTLPWEVARGRKTECGPFRVSFAYVQGERRATTLPPQEHASMLRKLNRIGGLYIYKDGIRILPYGDNNFDFLDVERRRTQSASYYFFSYRRMFGAIEISQDHNSALTEKAGREGFRENRAYREFRSILSNLLLNLAADFFREEGTRAETFFRRREEIEKIELARRRREKLVSMRKRTFREQLEKGLSRLEAQEPQKAIDVLIADVKEDLSVLARHHDPSEILSRLLRTEADARRRVDQIRISYRLPKPAGVGLPRDLRRDWEAYTAEVAQLEAVLETASLTVERLVGETAVQLHSSVDTRKRIEARVTERASESLKSLRQLAKLVRDRAEESRKKAIDIARTSVAEVDATIRQASVLLATIDTASLNEDELDSLRQSLITPIETAFTHNDELLRAVYEQLQLLVWEPDEQNRFVGVADTLEALDEELLELRERADLDLELTQLGLAIQVVNHEFDASIRSVRRNLESLEGWARLNPALAQIYGSIRTSFDHLDAYLNLFTPLSRRTHQSPVEIAGADIAQFLEDLFSERMIRHAVKLERTDRFIQKQIVGFPSSIYPVFVNLVDNALYWIQERAGDRRIILDADDRSFMVSDTGPGIPRRDRTAVFELGFSRKPGGRGMGLYISRDVLKRAGYDLSIDETGPGTTFRISQIESDEVDEE